MNPEPNRPIEQQRVIALLQEAKEPPADAETPGIPDDVLERLRGQYDSTARRAIVEDKPSVWAWFSDLFVQPRFALATALVLLCGVTAVMLRPSTPVNDLMRGGQTRPAAAPAYWLQSDLVEPAPSGLGMPKFIVITSDDPLPGKGEALIFDPSHREARTMKEGRITAKIAISDPDDNNEWLTAHRQLSKLSSP